MAIRKFKMTYVTCIMSLVDSTNWETLKSDQLNKQEQGIVWYEMVLGKTTQYGDVSSLWALGSHWVSVGRWREYKDCILLWLFLCFNNLLFWVNRLYMEMQIYEEKIDLWGLTEIFILTTFLIYCFKFLPLVKIILISNSF